MTLRELDAKYFTLKESRKKKGAGKGYKVSYARVWADGATPRRYLSELAEADSRACGLLLCKSEQMDMQEDRWWDVPTYRDEAIRTYRDRIKAIRLNYGLSKSEVAVFMRVG